MSITKMSRDELATEMRRLAAIEQISPADDALLDRLTVEFDRRQAEVDAVRSTPGLSAAAGASSFQRDRATSTGNTSGRTTGGDPDHDSGRRTIDDNFRSGWIPDFAAERASTLIDDGQPGERTLAARWAGAAGDPAYRSAFAKLCADSERGHLMWTPQEADAFRAAAIVSAELEARAPMSTSVGNGGYMIPLSLDPAIMLTSAGSINPLRQLATVKQTMTNSWRGITSAGVTSEWKTEGAEAADASPTVANADIPVFLGDAFVYWSYEVGEDAENFLPELTRLLIDSAEQLQATAYTVGDGVAAPQGIVTGLVGTASVLTGDGSEVIAASDAYKLQNALPARFSPNATWQMNIATMNTFRQFETSNGALKFPGLHEANPTLLGKPAFENSNMDGSINPAATEANYVGIYGDVARGFFIVDRVGARLEFIPNIVGANQRPTGQRGAVLWHRSGSKVVVPQALRLLNIPTTA